MTITAEQSLTSLAQQVRQRRQELDRKAGAAQEVARQHQAAQARTEALEHAVEVHEQAVRLLTSLGEERQESARHQVEELASRAMRVIFDEDISFHLEAGERGGQATLEFVVRSRHGDSEISTPVMDARGGGMAAVLGFVMRLTVLLLTPGTRKLLVLDESFGMVSRSYEPRVAEFLREVSHRAKVQIVLITHSDAFGDAADEKYRFALGADGVTQVFEGESELWDFLNGLTRSSTARQPSIWCRWQILLWLQRS